MRAESTRVFDVCAGCRLCTDLCEVFPALFELLDTRVGGDAGELTPVEQDRVVDACVHCGECLRRCPYAPARHALAIDAPMMVASNLAMRRATGQLGWRRRLAPRLVGVRRWKLRRRSGRRQRRVAIDGGGTALLWATCESGSEVVAAERRSHVGCVVSAAGCCGAPWLDAGDLPGFRRRADRNLSVLTAEIGDIGPDVAIVVVDPVCAGVIRDQYVRLTDVGDARQVVDRVVARGGSPGGDTVREQG